MIKEMRLVDIMGNDVLFREIDENEAMYRQGLEDKDFDKVERYHYKLQNNYENLGKCVAHVLQEKNEKEFKDFAWKSKAFEEFLNGMEIY